jgi:lysozyme
MIHNRIATHPTPSTEKAKGFDASKYQTGVNWDLVKREGFSFCILRASGANRWPDYTGLEVDRALDSHWRGAGSIGLLRGAYHFLVPDLDAQAKYFAQALGARRFELPLFADVEVGGTTKEKVQLFFQAADAWTGRRTGLYTNLAFYQSLNVTEWLGDRPLWMAQYGVTKPSVQGWDFW